MHEKEKITHGDKDPNPRNKYNLAPGTARVGYKYGKLHLGRYKIHEVRVCDSDAHREMRYVCV